MLTYYQYHLKSYEYGDIDPAYNLLKYICDRYELNIEQRYWLAFLYGCTYCGATVFYIYNEFPDFENVNIPRLERWWNEHKHRLLFQTDRMRIRSNNQFVAAYRSYQDRLDGRRQQDFIENDICTFPDAGLNYNYLYQRLLEVKYFGRYSLFLWLECMHELTGVNIMPTRIDWRNAKNCFNGVMNCFGLPERDIVTKEESMVADQLFLVILNQLRTYYPQLKTTVWNTETTLCAYKKYCHDKRYVGYYWKRMCAEIEKMKNNTPSKVCWNALLDYINDPKERENYGY
jgi:hypothetical protein